MQVVSFYRGQVVDAGYKGEYGFVVYVNSVYQGKQIQTRYAHLDEDFEPVGSNITAGSYIGKMGMTGNVTGALLHFELLESIDGNPCRVDGTNAVRKDPLLYTTPVDNDNTDYLSMPFAVGKVPGDTFALSSSSTLSVNTLSTTDIKNTYYIRNCDESGNSLPYDKAYLRKIAERFRQSRHLSLTITWVEEIQCAKIVLNNRERYYSTFLCNSSKMNDRLVVDRFDFYNYFFQQGIGNGPTSLTELGSYKSREQWYASELSDARLDLIEEPLRDYYDTVVIHHTVGPQYQDIGDLENKFILERQWPTIGYHFVIKGDGTVYEGMPINYVGWHVEENNSHKIGISLMGNFQHDSGPVGTMEDVLHLITDGEVSSTPTRNQLESLRKLIQILHYMYGINAVGGHKDFTVNGNVTECPGNVAYPLLKNEGIIP